MIENDHVSCAEASTSLDLFFDMDSVIPLHYLLLHKTFLLCFLLFYVLFISCSSFRSYTQLDLWGGLCNLLLHKILVHYFRCLVTGSSLLEDGGSILTFEGSNKTCTWKAALRVPNPQFYLKVSLLITRSSVTMIHNADYACHTISQVAMEADLGLAYAFINGDRHFKYVHIA